MAMTPLNLNNNYEMAMNEFCAHALACSFSAQSKVFTISWDIPIEILPQLMVLLISIFETLFELLLKVVRTLIAAFWDAGEPLIIKPET